MTVVSAVIRRLAEGLPGGFLFQRLSGDLTLRAQTRGRRGPCRLARTARPISPARSGAAGRGARGPVRGGEDAAADLSGEVRGGGEDAAGAGDRELGGFDGDLVAGPVGVGARHGGDGVG